MSCRLRISCDKQIVYCNSASTKGLAAFGVNFHSLLTEVWSMVNSQIPLLTGQPSVDVELLKNNALSTPGWSVEGGI